MTSQHRLPALLLSTLLLSSCGHPVTPFRLNYRVPKDLAARQITGRESLTLADGIRAHADHMFTGLNETTQFSGRVYLDGTQHRTPAPDLSGWPLRAYSDNAWWDAQRGRFSMSGHVAVEHRNGLITRSLQADTTVAVDHGRLKIEGPTHTASSALPQHW